MSFRIALCAGVALTLAACSSGGDGNVTATAAKPVAAIKAPAGQAWVDVVARTPEGGMRMGNPDAPIKLIEYGARTCPTCAAFDLTGFPILKSEMISTGKVSYEFREFPVHGPLDIAPILLGQCVEPAAFFPMLDEMYRNHQTLLAKEAEVAQGAQAVGNSPTAIGTYFAENLGYLDFVKQRGVPEAKARACLNDQKALDELTRQLKIADDKYHVSGTPTFIVNDKVAEGVLDWAGLKPVLVAAGA